MKRAWIAGVAVLAFAPTLAGTASGDTIEVRTWYAAPDGIATGDCPQDHPCTLRHALDLPGDPSSAHVRVVSLAGGDYEDDQTIATSRDLTITGSGSGAPVRIRSTADVALTGLTGGLRVDHVEIDGPQTGLSIMNITGASVHDSAIDHVVVRAGGDACIFQNAGGTISNSLCDSTERGALGVAADQVGVAWTARDVTAISHDGYGAVVATFGQTATLTLVNTISRGGLDDLAADGTGPATIYTNFSNYDRSHSFTGHQGTITQGAGNQDARPVFAAACHGDFHEGANSPTVDAGWDPTGSGPTDIDGDPRAIGPIDIGFDELVPPGPGDACAPPPPSATSTPPAVTSVVPRDLTPPAFTSASVRIRKHRATFRYRLSEPARVAFTVQRCSKRCKRIGRFSRLGPGGLNSKRWSRKLKAGRYRALLVATDAAGNRSRIKRLRFRVRP